MSEGLIDFSEGHFDLYIKIVKFATFHLDCLLLDMTFIRFSSKDFELFSYFVINLKKAKFSQLDDFKKIKVTQNMIKLHRRFD